MNMNNAQYVAKCFEIAQLHSRAVMLYQGLIESISP